MNHDSRGSFEKIEIRSQSTGLGTNQRRRKRASKLFRGARDRSEARRGSRRHVHRPGRSPRSLRRKDLPDQLDDHRENRDFVLSEESAPLEALLHARAFKQATQGKTRQLERQKTAPWRFFCFILQWGRRKRSRWRNWQTHYLEVVAPARAWRFESSPGHNPSLKLRNCRQSV